ncbi:MAG: leucine-rich repeat domain-containing protein [Ruminococcaceae bacterium]|jgi:Leucine-rich repeat (LRR) protein|nr:leucine-rich repeat domain-containing protein [Oscillospiraceae bacterium]
MKLQRNGLRCLLFAALLAVLLPLTAVTSRAAGVAIDKAHFPDEIFRSLVKDRYDENRNDVLDEDEWAPVTELDVSYYGVESLEGLQYFENVIDLDCAGCPITALDLSKNHALFKVDCSYCENLSQITHGGAAGNYDLAQLYCSGCALTELDLKDLSLQMLYCDGNRLTSLDVGSMLYLRELSCAGNRLTTLTLGNHPQLTILWCYRNRIAKLNVAKCPDLVSFNCSDNLLTSLDVSKCASLERLDCSLNEIPAIDVSKAVDLTVLNAGCGPMVSLDVTKNTKLTELTLGPSLVAIDLRNNTALRVLDSWSTQIKLLDVHKSPALVNLNLDYALGKIGRQVEGDTYIYSETVDSKPVRLSCYRTTRIRIAPSLPVSSTIFPDDQLRARVMGIVNGYNFTGTLTDEIIATITTLDVSNSHVSSLEGLEFLTDLKTLNAANNDLTELDLSGNLYLTSVDCHNNDIADIDLRSAARLRSLDCRGNEIDFLDLNWAPYLTDAVLNSDPTISNGTETYIHGSNKLAIDAETEFELAGTGVPIMYRTFPDPVFREAVRSFDVRKDGYLDPGDIRLAGDIIVPDRGIKSLKGVEYFPGISTLDCSGNLLTELNVSANTVLRHLYCQSNQLTSLDLAENFALLDLDCRFNSISDLSLQGAPHLSETVNNGSVTHDGGTVTYTSSSGTVRLDEGALAAVPGSVPITEKYFPDPNFRAFILETIDNDDNEMLSEYEADRLWKTVDCSNRGIRSLQGIKYLKFHRLDCSGNELTELDLSFVDELDDLYCENNRLTSLVLGAHEEMDTLCCEGNDLKLLDISGCPVLQHAIRYCLPNLHRQWSDERGDHTSYGSTSGTLSLDDKTELILDSEHSIVYVAAKAPTYTEEGWREHYRCAFHGELYEDCWGTWEVEWESLVIPRLGVDILDAREEGSFVVVTVKCDRRDSLTILVAEYKDGQFMRMHERPFTATSNVSSQEIPVTLSGDSFKVMVVDEDYKPLGAARLVTR